MRLRRVLPSIRLDHTATRLGAQHLDPLPALLDKAEPRTPARARPFLFVPVNHSLYSPNEQIEFAVAVDIDRSQNVLSVGHQRSAVDIADRVAERFESRGCCSSLVTPDADVASRHFTE